MTVRAPLAERIRDAATARDEGIARAEQAADPRVILAIDESIGQAIASGRRFSANDIRDRFPVCDEHLVGARIRSFAGRREDGHPLMVNVGRVASSLKSTHHHEIKVWLGWEAHQLAYRNQSGTGAQPVAS